MNKSVLIVSFFLLATVRANAINVKDVRTDGEPVNNLQIITGKVNNDIDHHTAYSIIGLYFEDATNSLATVKVSLQIEANYKTTQESGRRLYFTPQFTALALEDIVYKDGRKASRRSRDVVLSIGGSLTGSGNKSHEFGLLFRSLPINGVRPGKNYMFVGSFDELRQGDINEDTTVSLNDLNSVRNNFGANGNAQAGDTDFDGDVDMTDLNTVRNQLE